MHLQNQTLYSSPQFRAYNRTGSDEYVIVEPLMMNVSITNETTKIILEFFKDGNSFNELIKYISSEQDTELTEEDINAYHQFVEGLIQNKLLKVEPFSTKVKNDLWDQKVRALYIHLTYKCNLTCVYCYNMDIREDNNTLKGYLTPEDWKKVIHDAQELGVESVVYTGGEAMLYDGIFEIAEYAKQLGLRNELKTNATRITTENVDKIVELFDTLAISLDALDEEHNDVTRGSGSFKKIKKGLDIALDNGHKDIVICPVVNSKNIEAIGQLLEYAYSRDDLMLLAQEYCAYVSDTNPHDEELSLSSEDRSRLAQLYKEHDHSLVKKPTEFVAKDNCGMLKGEISIDPFGNLFPCQALHYPEFNQGNVKASSIVQVYNQEETIALRESVHVDNMDTCNTCNHRYGCAGGCRAVAYSRFGKITSHNKLDCWTFQQQNEERLLNLIKEV